MKKLYLLSLAFSFITLPAIAERFTLEAKSPRSINIGSVMKYFPIRDGKVNFGVVAPAGKNAKMQEAVSELCANLGVIFKSKITPVDKPSGQKFAIELKFAPESLKLDRDGFTVRTGENNVTIAGESEGFGLLFGVYDFLERFTGARFFFPGKYGTILPEKTDWALPEINIIDRPDSPHRVVYWKPSTAYGAASKIIIPWYDGDEKALPRLLKQHEKRIRLSSHTLPNCHGLRGLKIPERFAKTNPEFFALNEEGKRLDGNTLTSDKNDRYGQLCFSNPELKEIVYQDAAAALTGKPASSRSLKRWEWTQRPPFFNIQPNDSFEPCHCKECWKISSTLPQFGGKSELINSNFVWQWKADIAGRLQKAGIPGYVTSMAYTGYREIPAGVNFPSNMIVQVALLGPWGESNPKKQAEDFDTLRRWSEKLGAKVYLWNYLTKLTVQVAAIPNTSPRAVLSYYKKVFPYSFGTFFEAETDCWLYGYLNYYVFSKVMWDKDVNADELLKDHCQTMFGGGAGEMQKFFDIMEEHWLKNFAGNVEETAIGPVSKPPTEYKTWTQIFPSAERKRIAAILDRAEQKAGSKDALERVKYIRRIFWTGVEEVADEYDRKSNAKDKWTCSLPEKSETAVIDGDDSDAVWKDLKKIHLLPEKGKKADVHTTVRMFRTAKDLCFFFECEEPETAKMEERDLPFDNPNIWNGNSVEIYLNGDGTRSNYCQIMVNSMGSVADLKTDLTGHSADWKWNSNAKVKTKVFPGRKWTAEVQIPLSSLPEFKVKNFPGNFTRTRKLKDQKAEYFQWSCYTVSFGDVANFGLFCMEPDRAKELITNGDFTERDGHNRPVAWVNWGNSLQLDTKVFRTGGVSIRMDNQHRYLVHKVPELKPDTEYVFSFFVKLENIVDPGIVGKARGVYCTFRDGNPDMNLKDGLRYIMHPALKGTIPWQRMEYTFRTSKETGKKTTPAFWFSCPETGGGQAWIDSVSLKAKR